MNIALCFSGQVRGFSLTRESLKKYLLSRFRGNAIYVFAHSPSVESPFPFSDLDLLSDHVAFQCEDESAVLAPCQLSDNAVIDERSWHHGDSYRRFYLQLRSIYLANALCSEFSQRTGIHFDWVFRLRFDNLYFGEPLEDLCSLDARAIYIPHHDNWCGLNDRFAFGGPAAMEAYCQRYPLFTQYMDSGYPMHPEEFLAWTLRRAGTPVRRTRVTLHLFRYGHLWPATYLPSKGDGPPPSGRWWFKLWSRLRRTRLASLADRGYLLIIRVELLLFQVLKLLPVSRAFGRT